MEMETQKRVESVSLASEKPKRRKLTERDLVYMKLPAKFWTANFDRINEGDAKDVTSRYVFGLGHKFDPGTIMSKGYSLLLWGDNSRGKTSIAAVILKEARRRGFTCLFMFATDYRKFVIEREMFSDSHTYEQWAREVDMLVLDDFSKESGDEATGGGSERMYDDLLRHRYANLKPTIITTNGSAQRDIASRYGQSLVRLMEDSYVAVKVIGASQREVEQQKLIEFFKG